MIKTNENHIDTLCKISIQYYLIKSTEKDTEKHMTSMGAPGKYNIVEEEKEPDISILQFASSKV